MKILVTGANGMLGRDVCHAVTSAGHNLVGLTRQDLDVTNVNDVLQVVDREKPDIVIHCVAYTNVNGAEQNADEALRVNAGGARNVAKSCRETGAKMVYVSTDFVFDGEKGAAYSENDAPNPLSVYGASKEGGEREVRELLPNAHVIARTSWLYGGPPDTKNFVRTIQKLARTLPSVPVVSDQVGCPTYTVPVAQTLVALATDFVPGTYHVTCEGQASWFEFAQEIVRLSRLQTPVVPITGDEYEARFGPQAKRPAYSPLACNALRRRGMALLPHWKDALADFLNSET